MEQYLRVGILTNTHGLKGEVKVLPTTEDPDRFLDLTRVFVELDRGQKRELPLESVRFFKQFVICKFSGLDRIEDVVALKGLDLLIPREEGIPLEEGEFYIADLLGMEVHTDEGEFLGTVTDVIQTGANDVYVVRGEGGEILLPAIAECVLSVSPEENRMLVHRMKGL